MDSNSSLNSSTPPSPINLLPINIAAPPRGWIQKNNFIPNKETIMKEISDEANKIMKNKKLKGYFTEIFESLEQKSEATEEVKKVVRAINEIAHAQGDIEKVEQKIALDIRPDFNFNHLQTAGKIFKDCQRKDFRRGQTRVLDLNLSKTFKKINRDMIAEPGSTGQQLNLIPLRVMGKHKALVTNDGSMYDALKQLKLRDEDIVSYLDSQNSYGVSHQSFEGSEEGELSEDDFVSDEGDNEEEKVDITSLFSVDKHLKKYEQPSKKQESQAQTDKIKMFDKLENIDILSKEVEAIPISKNSFINYLRQQVKEKYTDMKAEKDLFQSQLKKMQNAHLRQIKNVEIFAMSAASELFKRNAQQVRKEFNKEVSRLTDEYQKLHSLIHYYERKIKSLIGYISSQERLIIDQQVYIIQYLKRMGDFENRKYEAQNALLNLQCKFLSNQLKSIGICKYVQQTVLEQDI